VTLPRSLWWDQVSTAVPPRDALRTDLSVDVAIVGGGFSGLWTARELLRRDPHLQIAILEKSICGFGASGRNGGWASALFPIADDVVARHYGDAALIHQRRLLERSVADLGEALAADEIDGDFHQGGTLTFARSDIQARRLRTSAESSAGDLQWLDEDAVRDYGVVAGQRGATFSPHCARLHPAKVVRGLATVVERLGARIFEGTTVTKILPRHGARPARVVTVGGEVQAQFVIRATEGFTPTLAGARRDVAPVYSLMIATSPQSPEFWQTYGFEDFPTFADDRHLIIYGQRTSDGRLAFGGRGAPYHFGSTVEPRFDENARVFDALLRTLCELFPGLEGGADFSWGGPLAMPRDLSPFVTLDHNQGLAALGGYTGDGVVLSFVAARALADLICTPDVVTDYTSLPFVQHHSKRWEIEPFRWLGINAGLGLAAWADHAESRGRTSRASQVLTRLFDAL
jgi:glycine/D-amino acid oxidase-like deaminating enzyme